VCTVRYKKGGSKFEIACFQNKVMDWREGIEKDIDEVLQTPNVFTNVSKGAVAPTEDLLKVFGTDDKLLICRIILNEGELQVSEKERKREADNKFRDIAQFVATKCVNSETKRPFPISMIESAMKEIHISVNSKKSAKQQALDVIRELKSVLPIERAQMRLRVSAPKKLGKQVKTKLEPLVAQIEQEDWPGDMQMVVLIDPGSYRAVDDAVKEITKGKGNIEILAMKKDVAGSMDIESVDSAPVAAPAAAPAAAPQPSSVFASSSLFDMESRII